MNQTRVFELAKKADDAIRFTFASALGELSELEIVAAIHLHAVSALAGIINGCRVSGLDENKCITLLVEDALSLSVSHESHESHESHDQDLN